MPDNFCAMKIGKNSAKLFWRPSEHTNKELESYYISYSMEGTNESRGIKLDLLVGKSYTFYASVVTGKNSLLDIIDTATEAVVMM